MIITLVKANFSANNIGTLDSFAVLTNIVNATYNGPTSVGVGEAFTATITMHDGYVVPDNIAISMGGNVLTNAYNISDNVITISVAAVTGVIIINMAGILPSIIDITSLFDFTQYPKTVCNVTNTGKAPRQQSSSYFDSAIADISTYAGKTIKIMIPQYTSSAGTQSMNATYLMNSSKEFSTMLKLWDLNDKGAKTGKLVEYTIQLPSDAQYLFTSIFNNDAISQGIGNVGFYCKVVD